MKNTGRITVWEGKSSCPHRLLDLPFAFEMGDSGPAVGRGHRGVDEMRYAGLPAQPRKPYALLHFPLGARFPGVLNGKNAPDPVDGPGQRLRIVKIAPNDLGLEVGQFLGGLAIRPAGHGSNAISAGQQLPGDGPALPARSSRNQNAFFILHDHSPLSQYSPASLLYARGSPGSDNCRQVLGRDRGRNVPTGRLQLAKRAAGYRIRRCRS